MALLTWICSRDDGSKEEAVSEEKIFPQLPHDFHEGHKAIHDQSRREEGFKQAGSDEG